MAVLEKDILRPGEWYVENNGEVGLFSADAPRIKHWANVGAEMLSSGLRIPVIWEHTEDENDRAGLPLTETELAHDAAARYTRNTAGYVTQFGVGENGELMARIDVEGPDAEKIGTVVHDVSPFIREEFRDGNGNVWHDAICHVALTTQPVVTGQGKFKTVALSRGGAFKFVRLARPFGPAAQQQQRNRYQPDEPDEPDDEEDEDETEDPQDQSNAYGASLFGEDGQDGGTNNEAGDVDHSQYMLPQDDDESADELGESVDLELIQDLAMHGIVIPESTSAEDLVAHLKTALRTSAAHKQMARAAQSAQQQAAPQSRQARHPRVAPGTKPAGQMAEETTSVALSASRDLASTSRESTLEKALFNERRHVLRRRLVDCLRTGRCTAYQHDKITQRIGSVKLSLNQSGRIVDDGGVEDQVALLEANPVGSQFGADDVTEHDNEDFFSGNEDQMSEAEASRIADHLHGKAK